MKNGYIGFVRRKDYRPMAAVSASVRFFTDCYYNHTVYFIKIWGKEYILEANENGVQLLAYHLWKKKYRHEIAWIKPYDSQVENDRFAARLLTHVGKKYDYYSLLFAQLLYQISIKLKRPYWPGLQKPSRFSDKLYCSEIGALELGLFQWERAHTGTLMKHFGYDPKKPIS